MARNEATHYEILYFNGTEIVVEKEYDFKEVENKVWFINKDKYKKFIKVFEVKYIFENFRCVNVEITEEKVEV